MKNHLILTIAFLALILGGAACAAKLNAGAEKINKTSDGLAIKGYDAVAYRTVELASRGKPEYEFIWNGAKWLFSNAENLEKFRKNPELYAPQYGGYCSYAVSRGYTADGDPEAWKIVGGKLYLNYNQQVKEMWEKEMNQSIREGDKNWQEFQTQKPEHKGS